MPRIRLGKRRRLPAARRSALKLIRELPNLLKLLVRLIKDHRVSRLDRILFAAVITYVLTPADLLPDFLGVLGFADDLDQVGLALNRLFSNAGPRILLEHWEGNPRALGYLVEGVEDIGSLLPAKVRSVLKGFV